MAAGSSRVFKIAFCEAIFIFSQSFNIITFEEDTPLELITALEPDILVKGGDYEVEEVVGSKEIIERGGEVQILCYKEGFSTSAIIEKLKT